MKKQLFVHAKAIAHNNKIFAIIPLLWGIIVFSSGCKKNTIEAINALPETNNLPTTSLTGVNFIYSSESKMVMEIKAPNVENFTKDDEPYMEFKEGIDVWFYDSTETLQSRIHANYAIYHQNEELWTARNNVEVINSIERDTLFTEELFWDQNSGQIYTDQYVRIVKKDGIIHGKGLTAKQDLSNYRVRNISETTLSFDEQETQQKTESPKTP